MRWEAILKALYSFSFLSPIKCIYKIAFVMASLLYVIRGELMAIEDKMSLKLLFGVKIFLRHIRITTYYPKGIVHYLVIYVLTWPRMVILWSWTGVTFLLFEGPPCVLMPFMILLCRLLSLIACTWPCWPYWLPQILWCLKCSLSWPACVWRLPCLCIFLEDGSPSLRELSLDNLAWLPICVGCVLCDPRPDIIPTAVTHLDVHCPNVGYI